MNIIEAYIKFNNQLIILISGLPGCGKLELAKNLARDTKLHLLDENDYYIKNYDEKIQLTDEISITNLYTDKAIDWDLLNSDIDKFKSKGVIVVGFSFPKDKIKPKIDYHLHLNIPKQICIEKRKEFLEKHKDKYPEDYKLIGSPIENLKMNKLIFPYYLEAKSQNNTHIDKILNINYKEDDPVYDEVFDIIINFIQLKLKKKEQPKTPKVTEVSKNLSADVELSEDNPSMYELLTDTDSDMITELSKSNETSDVSSDKIKDGRIKFFEPSADYYD